MLRYAVPHQVQKMPQLFRTRFKPFERTICSQKTKRDARDCIRYGSRYMTSARFELFVGARREMEESTTCCTVRILKYTVAEVFSDVCVAPAPPKKTNFRRANMDGLIHIRISSEMRWEFLPSEFLCIYKKNRCSSLRRRASYTIILTVLQTGLDCCVRGHILSLPTAAPFPEIL